MLGKHGDEAFASIHLSVEKDIPILGTFTQTKHGLNSSMALLDLRQKEYRKCSLGEDHKHAPNVVEKLGIRKFLVIGILAVVGEFSVHIADTIT